MKIIVERQSWVEKQNRQKQTSVHQTFYCNLSHRTTGGSLKSANL